MTTKKRIDFDKISQEVSRAWIELLAPHLRGKEKSRVRRRTSAAIRIFLYNVSASFRAILDAEKGETPDAKRKKRNAVES